MTEQFDNKSFILVRFNETGSVVLDVAFQGVTPLQVLAAASYLELRGKNELIVQENQRMAREAEQNLAKPRAEILIPGR